MLRFIDISNHQGRDGISLPAVLPSVDAVVVKATESVDYVDAWCDGFVQTCISRDVPWGFYHFARGNDPVAEADFFMHNTANYFGEGIPILDWEDGQSVDWVNRFVWHVHETTNVWPWIYANPWRFNQGGVEPCCMRWVASYPAVTHPTFDDAMSWTCPDADGLVGAWQFCSDGRLSGYNGNLDCNLFYGEKEGWLRYAGSDASSGGDGGLDSGSGGSAPASVSTLENDEYRITVERK